MRVTTRAGKTAEAAIKQIAFQELQVEKVRIEEWKQNVMQDVVRELQAMKQTQEEAMEVQRRGFQMELEKLREELQRVESQSMMLENKMKFLKTQKQAPAQRLAQNPLVVETAPGQSSAKPTEDKKVTNPSQKSYAQIAASSSAKNAMDNSWTEVTNSSRKKKGNSSNPPKLELEKRRVIFRREPVSP